MPTPRTRFFSDGLTEEIITDLSRVRALRVTSRTSSMQHKGSAQGLREISHALGVRYLLTGSVRRAASALRISAQLVDATEDRQLWGATFAGTMDDVFDLQERVSREIVGALGITLHPDEDRRLAARGIRHAAAYELYLQARAEMRLSWLSGERWNALLLDRAVAIEGDTPTLRGLRLWGEVLLLKSGMGDPSRLGDIERQARALVAIAPDSASGYAALGYVGIETGDMGAAIRWFREAITYDPTDSDSRYWLMAAFAYAGLLDEAASVAAELRVFDPLSSLSTLAGTIVWFSGRVAETIAPLQRVLADEPQNFGALWSICYARAVTGDLGAAQRDAETMRSMAPDAPYVVQADALLRVLGGDEAGGLARIAGLDLAPFDAHLTFHIAEVFAMAGEIDRGLDVLTLAMDKGFTPVPFIATHCPFIAPLRGHPRFAGLVAEATARSEAVRRNI